MEEVSKLLSAVEAGDPQAASRLLPLVYEELRRLAAQKLAREAAGQTLQPTALVHEAYLRLIGDDEQPHWTNQAHFFGAAAQAMRRILVENARRKRSLKHGGDRVRQDFDESLLRAPETHEDVEALDEALKLFADKDPLKARLVELRYFGGLTIEETAQVLDISTATAERYWTYARAWLLRKIAPDENAKRKKNS
jgi:RNA polymerase sigma factor (TIGR02999 family)